MNFYHLKYNHESEYINSILRVNHNVHIFIIQLLILKFDKVCFRFKNDNYVTLDFNKYEIYLVYKNENSRQ